MGPTASEPRRAMSLAFFAGGRVAARPARAAGGRRRRGQGDHSIASHKGAYWSVPKREGRSAHSVLGGSWLCYAMLCHGMLKACLGVAGVAMDVDEIECAPTVLLSSHPLFTPPLHALSRHTFTCTPLPSHPFFTPSFHTPGACSPT